MNLIVAEKRKTSPRVSSKNGAKEIYYPESDSKPIAETDFHIKTIINLHQTLEIFLKEKSDVRVFSDIMFYYEKGSPHKSIAPDVMIVSGISKHLRRVFKLWEENVPDVIFEISSRGTWQEDLQKKYLLYESFGVKEYCIFDPEYDYLPEPFIAFHLKNKNFKQAKIKNGGIFSPSLGLEIVDTGETLRLFNQVTRSFLPTMEELAKQATRAEELESEVEKLKAELGKLREQK